MREIDPQTTNRDKSYQLFINAPMPMVTIFKTLDLTNLVLLSKKGYKLNMLMCYRIGQAANEISEFKLLPVGKKLIAFDKIGINVIVANKNGGINSCDIPFEDNLSAFNHSYQTLTQNVSTRCEDFEIENAMIIGTSCLAKYDFDGVANMYTGIFNNPFLIWGRYSRAGFRFKLKISFQFHHVQMDGEQACEFLEKLQMFINRKDI